MKMKNLPDLAYMKLGLSRQYDLENKVDKLIPIKDPKNRVLKVMLSESICGISALESLGSSTTEWNQSIIAMLNKIPVLVRIENPMVIIGESGTGKESMANVLHRIANGEDKPFITLNCSAIPKDMLESELFGYEKGAFTGAYKQRKGMIELAKGGSLFLDELGKMEKNLQHKLLRVIEEQELRRLGSEEVISIDDVLFIIALQPNDIDRETELTTIAVDLFNRLNIYNAIELPPLKKRLKADPNIIHDVLEKLQKNIDLMSSDDKKIIEAWEKKVNEARDKFQESLERTDKSSEEVTSELDNTILPNQRMWTKESINHWNVYIKYDAELLTLKSPLRLSPEAEVAIVTHDGYEGKNFRELENILKSALLNAHIAQRKEILWKDLPEKVRNKLSSETGETQEITLDETINVLLKDIIDYADEKKKSIVGNKISSIRKSGRTIKGTLKLEGALKKESDYTGFYKKIERILGKAFIRDIGA